MDYFYNHLRTPRAIHEHFKLADAHAERIKIFKGKVLATVTIKKKPKSAVQKWMKNILPVYFAVAMRINLIW